MILFCREMEKQRYGMEYVANFGELRVGGFVLIVSMKGHPVHHDLIARGFPSAGKS